MPDVLPIGPADGSWDKPGKLSIVLQGGVFARNLASLAIYCRHWRQLFPKAQIVLAISQTDVIARTGSAEESHGEVSLVPDYAADGELQAARAAIVEACVEIGFARPALPLPPIKNVIETPNNVNLQIVAAQRGLELATGDYVLRVRNDLVFADRSFLTQYKEGAALPRGPAAALRQRVLISWLYTLNPYTIERMPLHFSDWFHFGLTEDVRALWAIEEMSFADSIFYRVHPHARDTNADERRLLPRLAVEQHVIYNAFRRKLPEMRLAYHNDRTDIERSVDILVDNFNVCDVGLAHCYFRKYESDFFHPAKRLHCVTRTDWMEMAKGDAKNRSAVLSRKWLSIQHPEKVGFPRVFEVAELSTTQSFRTPHELVAANKTGQVFFGPYTSIPRGLYRAVVRCAELGGSGAVTLSATTNEGQRVLSKVETDIESAATELAIEFEILDDVAFGVEIVCSIRDLEKFAVSGLSIDKVDHESSDETVRYFSATSNQMKTSVGHAAPTGLATSGRAGFLLYGPHITLEKGCYRVSFVLKDVRTVGGILVEITGGTDQTSVARPELSLVTGANVIDCEFTIRETMRNVEFRIFVDHRSEFVVQHVELKTLIEPSAIAPIVAMPPQAKRSA